MLFLKYLPLFGGSQTYLRSTIRQDRLKIPMLFDIHTNIKITPQDFIEELSIKNTLESYNCNICKKLMLFLYQ